VPSPNTRTFAGPFEEGDVTRPRLGRVGVLAGRRSVRVRFVLSEPARVTVRAGRRSAARTFARAGVGTLTVRRVPAGKRPVRVVAVDPSGLATTVRRAVRVRG
jgi:hypothetical protein